MPAEQTNRPGAGLEYEDLSLMHEVAEATAGVSHLEMCIQCGTCGGSCPSAADMDHTPRMLFAMLRAGMRDEVLRSNTHGSVSPATTAWCAVRRKCTSQT